MSIQYFYVQTICLNVPTTSYHHVDCNGQSVKEKERKKKKLSSVMLRCDDGSDREERGVKVINSTQTGNKEQD